MRKLTATLALALLSVDAQSATNSIPAGDDALLGTGIPKFQFCHTRGTEHFSCDPIQQLPASFANTSADALESSLTSAGCTDRHDGSIYCRGDALQSGVDSVWWRFQKDGYLTTTYVYVYD